MAAVAAAAAMGVLQARVLADASQPTRICRNIALKVCESSGRAWSDRRDSDKRPGFFQTPLRLTMLLYTLSMS